MQVKVARVPTLMVKPVSIRLYNDSRVLYHVMRMLVMVVTIMQCIVFMMMTMQYIVTQVVWSKKMNFDVACLMKFHHFPFEYEIT